MIILTLARSIIKKIYRSINWQITKTLFVKRGFASDLGWKFRFTRKKPNKAYLGEKTCTDCYNIWNANYGDISIGKNCWIGLHNIVMGPVTIGDYTSTGPYVKILGPAHAIYKSIEKKRIRTEIGENVWISTGSIILYGVRIGDNAIIGPGSVITRDVSSNSYVAGNPARDLTNLSPFKAELKERKP